jgi:hypothetical protein
MHCCLNVFEYSLQPFNLFFLVRQDKHLKAVVLMLFQVFPSISNFLLNTGWRELLN